MSVATANTKVALKGSFGNREAVVERLAAAGIEVVSLIRQADLVLTGNNVPQSTVKQANKAGKEMVDVNDYLDFNVRNPWYK